MRGCVAPAASCHHCCKSQSEGKGAGEPSTLNPHLYSVHAPTCPKPCTLTHTPHPEPQVIKGADVEMQFFKVVNDELIELMGSKGSKDLEPGFPQIVLMAGLQVCVCGGGGGASHRS